MPYEKSNKTIDKNKKRHILILNTVMLVLVREFHQCKKTQIFK